MAVILQNANETSLIIVDELARSTSTEEGIGICYAICERLLSTGAFVLFATHFLDMAHLALNYPDIVKNYHFTSVSRLHTGPYEGPLYGLELAELATFPDKIIKEARELAERIRKAKENCAVTSSLFESSVDDVDVVPSNNLMGNESSHA
uniref:DNA mismatch repair proteins mutS family domain-containing protein n=1 Tax=Globodera rostochiensis TaxID=31243 RepID=A0A914I8M9_GLORO